MSDRVEASESTAVQPYISASNLSVPEFTARAIIVGSIFGILFGASTVYLALKAGLTVSASIPIAVLAISIGKRFLGTSILENNIIQTCGSAGESVAAGVVFTLPAFIFLSGGVGAGVLRNRHDHDDRHVRRHPRNADDDSASATSDCERTRYAPLS